MAEYRLFELSDLGAITRPPVILTGDDDAHAVAQADNYHRSNRMELWRGPIRVGEWTGEGRIRKID